MTRAPDNEGPLSRRELSNLVAFARLYGIVRYFHPSEAAQSADWKTAAIDGVRLVRDAGDDHDLIRRLMLFTRPLAPTANIVSGDRPKPVAEKPTTPGDVAAWLYHGYSEQSSGQVYFRELVRESPPPSDADAAANDMYELGPGLWAFVPSRLLVKDDARESAGTIGEARVREQREEHSAGSQAVRLAAVVELWNVYQHFFPYFDYVTADWQAVLETSLSEAALATTELSFMNTLRKLVAKTRDGHGLVRHPSHNRSGRLPILFEWVEGAPLVVHVDPGAGRVRLGDQILTIDGVAVDDLIAADMPLVAGLNPEFIRQRALARLVSGPPESTSQLMFEGADGRYETGVVRSMKSNELPPVDMKTIFNEVSPGIYYVDLNRPENGAFETMLPKLSGARGIVFDLRGYPRVTGMLALLSRMTDRALVSAEWQVPAVSRPNRTDMRFDSSRGRWQISPRTPRLTQNIVFLIGERAISYGESVLQIVEHFGLAILVGKSTAGTNGNVVVLSLPGGYEVYFTGLRVDKIDGSPLYGAGVKPDVVVERTRAGVRAGRDEVLERGIEEAVRRRI